MTTKSRRYFGTDGIRGAANQFPMNADVALKVGRAAGDYFKRRGAPIAVVGKDTRVSGYMIESALTAGLLSVGVQVVKLGVLPTPAVSMLTKSLRAGMGVMISASHNPYHDNGIKLFNADGGKLSDTCEEEIEALIDDNDSLTLPDATGVSKIRKQKDASGRYIEFIKQLFPEKQTLSGMKIALDCANGAAFRIGPTVLRELGAECIDIAASPNGVNINKGCGSTHPEALAEKTREAGAAIGIALDGDADRIIVCDENGKIYSGDNILAALAVYMKKRDLLPGSALAVTRMSNLGMEEYLNGCGIKLFRTDVGDRYVAEAMRKYGLLLGGEQSGHIILGDHGSTGDGMATAIRLLAVMCEENCAASELLGCFEPYPQVLHNLRFDADKRPNVELLDALQEEANAALGRSGRVILRRSGTEPLVRIMVEGKCEKTNAEYVEKIRRKLS